MSTAEVSHTMITGMIFVCYQPISTLFDLDSIFSYVSAYLVPLLGLYSKPLSVLLQIATSTSDFLEVG